MGRAAYDLLVGFCEAHLARAPVVAPHPADAQPRTRRGR